MGGRREMKVGIETCHGMDLAERHLDFRGEFLQPIGRQVAELMLNGPEFVDQARGSPWFPQNDEIGWNLNVCLRLGDWRTWGRSLTTVTVRRPLEYLAVN